MGRAGSRPEVGWDRGDALSLLTGALIVPEVGRRGALGELSAESPTTVARRGSVAKFGSDASLGCNLAAEPACAKQLSFILFEGSLLIARQRFCQGSRQQPVWPAGVPLVG